MNASETIIKDRERENTMKMLTPKQTAEMMIVVRDKYPSALSWSECKELPTPRLLAYYKKRRSLRRIGEEFLGDDWHDDEQTDLEKAKNKLANNYMDGIKTMLNDRGHV